jgi:hypothetical protein
MATLRDSPCYLKFIGMHTVRTVGLSIRRLDGTGHFCQLYLQKSRGDATNEVTRILSAR